MTSRTTGALSGSPRRARVGRWLWIFAAAIVYLIPFFSLQGALDIYLKIGDIRGDAEVEGHEDEIEILSWGWGASQTSGATKDGFRNPAPKEVRNLVLTKVTDKSTPAILLECFMGRHIDDATLSVTQSSGKGPLEYLKIQLKDVFVTSYDITGDDDSALPVERFGLGFDHLKVTYTLFAEDGGKEGGTSEVFWTLSTNTGGGTSDGGSGGTGPPPNTAPSISSIGNQSVNEDGSVTVNFTVGDAQTPAGSLFLGRSSSNTILLPLNRIVFGGSGSNRNVTLSPFFNETGTSSVVIIVSDGSRTDSTSFTLTVNPVNDPPSLQQLGAQVTQADVPLNVSVTMVDIDSNINNATLTGVENPQNLVASITDTTLTGNVRNLRIVPTAGLSGGPSTITLTASDDATPPGQTSTSFSFTVNPPSDGSGGPSAILINGLPSNEPVRVDENAAPGTELGIFEAVDTPGLQHEFTLLDDAGGTFSLGAPFDPRLIVLNDTLLDFEAQSPLSIAVQARDIANPERIRTEVFTIELQNVNEPPAITLPPGFGTTAPDTEFSLDGIVIEDPDSGPEDIVATFTVTDGVLNIDDSGALAGKTAGNFTNSASVTAPLAEITAVLAAPFGLVYRSDPAFTGTETLTVTTDDGGNTGPPGPLTDLASSTLEVELTSWELWRRANFTAVELLDPAISSFRADPDRDGLSNGGEYGVGSLPKDQSSGPDLIELVYVESAGDVFPALRFPRRVSDPDFGIGVEVAIDLLNWVSGLAFTNEEFLDPIDPDFDQPTIRTFFPVSLNPDQQIRLRFTLASP